MVIRQKITFESNLDSKVKTLIMYFAIKIIKLYTIKKVVYVKNYKNCGICSYCNSAYES